MFFPIFDYFFVKLGRNRNLPESEQHALVSLKLYNLIMNDNKLLAISPTLPGLKATFLPIYQVPDIVYAPFAYWEKCIMLGTYYV